MIGSDPMRRRSYGRRPKGLFGKLIGALVIITVLTFIAVNRQGLWRLRKLQQDQKILAERIEQLQAETGRLQTQRARLEVDMAYIEQLAREKYRMVRQGEKLFRVVPRQTSETPPPLPGN